MTIDSYCYRNNGLPVGQIVRMYAITSRTPKRDRATAASLPHATMRTRSLYSGQHLCVLAEDALRLGLRNGQYGYATIPASAPRWLAPKPTVIRQ